MDTPRTPQAYEVVIRWLPTDLQYLCPYLTDDDAAYLLELFEHDIVNRSIERGWDVIEQSLTQSGYTVDPAYRGD